MHTFHNPLTGTGSGDISSSPHSGLRKKIYGVLWTREAIENIIGREKREGSVSNQRSAWSVWYPGSVQSPIRSIHASRVRIQSGPFTLLVSVSNQVHSRFSCLYPIRPIRVHLVSNQSHFFSHHPVPGRAASESSLPIAESAAAAAAGAWGGGDSRQGSCRGRAAAARRAAPAISQPGERRERYQA